MSKEKDKKQQQSKTDEQKKKELEVLFHLFHHILVKIIKLRLMIY